MTDPVANAPSDTSPGWLRWLTRVSLVIGVAALVITIWIVGLHAILDHLAKIGWFFGVLIVFEIVSSILDGTAVYFMAHGPGRPSWREVVVVQLAGRGVNAVTPGGNLGEALKIGMLSRRCSPRRIVAAVMYAGLIAVVFSFSTVILGLRLQ